MYTLYCPPLSPSFSSLYVICGERKEKRKGKREREREKEKGNEYE